MNREQRKQRLKTIRRLDRQQKAVKNQPWSSGGIYDALKTLDPSSLNVGGAVQSLGPALKTVGEAAAEMISTIARVNLVPHLSVSISEEQWESIRSEIASASHIPAHILYSTVDNTGVRIANASREEVRQAINSNRVLLDANSVGLDPNVWSASVSIQRTDIPRYRHSDFDDRAISLGHVDREEIRQRFEPPARTPSLCPGCKYFSGVPELACAVYPITRKDSIEVTECDDFEGDE